MKEIVVISGKGGTGKTSITASFAVLAGKDVVVADCDVDAADMHLLLHPDFKEAEDFFSGEMAYISQHDCIRCGKCFDVCRFNGIDVIDGKFIVNKLNCEGCGYCARVCPADSIINKPQLVGKSYISTIKTGGYMVHAKLGIGADNSGKLVAHVKNKAREIAEEDFLDYIIVDGSPGVGCPVVSSLSGAKFVVLVTEPSVSGIHDLKRVYALVKKFNIKTGCIINKHDINTEIKEEIIQFLIEEDIIHLANIPYDEVMTGAMMQGRTIVEFENGILKVLLEDIWTNIKQIVNIL